MWDHVLCRQSNLKKINNKIKVETDKNNQKAMFWIDVFITRHKNSTVDLSKINRLAEPLEGKYYFFISWDYFHIT